MYTFIYIFICIEEAREGTPETRDTDTWAPSSEVRRHVSREEASREPLGENRV